MSAFQAVGGRGGDIAFLQFNLGAEPGHPAAHLVAVDPAVVGELERRVAPPEVEVRAANVGHTDADQDPPRLHLGERE